MRYRDIEVWDTRTGEKLDAVPTLWQEKRRNGFADRWLAVAQEALMDLATDDRLQGQDLRVLLILLGKLDFENWLQVCQADLADLLGMTRGNMSRSMKRLVDIGVLLPGPKVGQSRTYRLNPSYGWKGSAKKHREVLKDRLSVIQGGKQDEDVPSSD